MELSRRVRLGLRRREPHRGPNELQDDRGCGPRDGFVGPNHVPRLPRGMPRRRHGRGALQRQGASGGRAAAELHLHRHPVAEAPQCLGHNCPDDLYRFGIPLCGPIDAEALRPRGRVPRAHRGDVALLHRRLLRVRGRLRAEALGSPREPGPDAHPPDPGTRLPRQHDGGARAGRDMVCLPRWHREHGLRPRGRAFGAPSPRHLRELHRGVVLHGLARRLRRAVPPSHTGRLWADGPRLAHLAHRPPWPREGEGRGQGQAHPLAKVLLRGGLPRVVGLSPWEEGPRQGLLLHSEARAVHHEGRGGGQGIHCARPDVTGLALA
mmetsp:Transcript_136687/g.424627  ORF Transcript_136687/g.424627 Transcript_136687/m.424627 type:complete len:322 (+) Transcript_136687:1129-2094(+)